MWHGGLVSPLLQSGTTRKSACCLQPLGLRRAIGAIPESTVEELEFIRKAQALGFSLGEVGEILTLSRRGQIPCSHVLSLAQQHLVAIEARIRQLQEFRDQLAAELAKWDGKKTPTCRGLCEIIAAGTQRGG